MTTRIRSGLPPPFLIAVLLLTGACGMFARHEDVFTPIDPPVTDVLVSERETTFVFSAPAYDFLARRRSALWQRNAVDDVAWQYRRLFGELPERIAVLVVDSTGLQPTAGERMRDEPLVMVAAAPAAGRRQAAPGEDGLLRRRLRYQVAKRWVWSAAGVEGSAPRGTAQRSEDVPDGTDSLTLTERDPAAQLPAWFELAATTMLAAPGVEEMLAARMNQRIDEAPSLDSLFAARPAFVDSLERLLVGVGPGARGMARGRGRRAAADGGRDDGALFIAQSISVLEFVRQRDGPFVATLARGLAAGRSVADLLPSSTVLPDDVHALEVQWREWVRQRASSDRRR